MLTTALPQRNDECVDVTFSLLADGANISQMGTLNVLGRFGRLYVGRLPARHPSMTLVLEFSADPLTEAGRQKHIHVALVEPDGREVKTVDADAVLAQPTAPGPMVTMMLLEFRDVEVRTYGAHEFVTKIDGEVKVSTRFDVVQLPAQEEPSHDDATALH